MKNVLPWIPIFGGIYCQFKAVEYFRDVDIQLINFLYHILLIILTMTFIK